VNANSDQLGWIEWKKLSNGDEVCRFRCWVPESGNQDGRRKLSSSWMTGLRKRKANRMLQDWLSEICPVTSIPEPKTESNGLNFRQFTETHWETYQQNRGVKESTKYSHRGMLKNHILPLLGSSPLAEITPADISNFLRDLGDKGLSSKFMLNNYLLLHAMFEVALELDLISNNPVRKKLHRPKHTHKKMPFWTVDQVKAVLREIPTAWQAFFYCLALTTVRIGELLALKWRDIDWEGRTITFGKTLWRGKVQSTTKTNEEYIRHMPDGLARLLNEHLRRSIRLAPDDFVFSRSEHDDRPCDPDEVRLGVLYPALDRCSIPRTPRASGFHAFRRAASKYLRQQAGLELAAVQLGHKQMTTTDTFYNDRDLADRKRAAELIEAAILGRLAPES
jgi:integrase